MAVTGGVNSFAAAASRQRFLPLSITIAKEKQDSSSSLKIQTQHHRPTTSRPYLPPRAASTNKSRATSIIITARKLNNTNINNINERNTKKRNLAAVVSVSTKDDLDVLPVDSNGDSVDNVSASSSTRRAELEEDGSKAGVLVFESSGGGGAAGLSASSSPSPSPSLLEIEGEDFDRTIDRAINAAIVLAAGTFAITKLLTIDIDYWHGWTLYEILRYAPQHNWIAYEEALKTNPVLAKMFISGVVYSLGDWIAQCVEGKPLFDFDRTRMFRSGLVGFMLHGSLSHYYYYFCEALFPSKDWWVVPAKVAFDQTAWSAIWNSFYYVALGLLRFESPVSIYTELSSTFWPMLTAGWKLWPFAHLITYGVIPVEQRLLWVDCVELVWVTILSTYSNEKSEARHTEALSEE